MVAIKDSFLLVETAMGLLAGLLLCGVIFSYMGVNLGMQPFVYSSSKTGSIFIWYYAPTPSIKPVLVVFLL